MIIILLKKCQKAHFDTLLALHKNHKTWGILHYHLAGDTAGIHTRFTPHQPLPQKIDNTNYLTMRRMP